MTGRVVFIINSKYTAKSINSVSFGLCSSLLSALLYNSTLIDMAEDGQGEENPGYGGCEGPDSMYVKLISSDGHEFIIKREHALMSGTIKAMLNGPGEFSESETNEIHFREISSRILSKVCMYLAYKARYTNNPIDIPDFPVTLETVMELLMAANFLDC
ncbi:elongin-C-like [Aphis gossypii]|uniref:elongin-C-like n=1 Tax=Aphis gossypii TaxID=80765 RepID=UPI0021596817|nr:elongin-C-like [Aphis gossypii]